MVAASADRKTVIIILAVAVESKLFDAIAAPMPRGFPRIRQFFTFAGGIVFIGADDEIVCGFAGDNAGIADRAAKQRSLLRHFIVRTIQLGLVLSGIDTHYSGILERFFSRLPA